MFLKTTNSFQRGNDGQRDREKTPIIKSDGDDAPQSTISRLESKYSEILDRVAKRKQKLRQEMQQNDDRDKTLEPDDHRSNMPTSLAKSRTTANILKSDKKERTPFRLDLNKYKFTSDVDTDVKVKRSDLVGLSSNPNLLNYNDYHDTYTKLKSNDSGYYDGYRGHGKENIYKSKYDPDVLLSELSSTRKSSASQQQPSAGSSTSRQIKPYKRTESGDKRRTAINLYELQNDKDDHDSELTNRYQRRHQYTQRKSLGNALRPDNHRRDLFEVDEERTELEKIERENKRKEIQSLIMKYAQMDDFYGKPSGSGTVYKEAEKDEINNNSSNHVVPKIDPWDPKSKYSPIVIPKRSAHPLGKSQTMANVSSPFDSTSWYMSSSGSNNIVPIKTNMTPTSSRSRMTKALSTFVRKRPQFNVRGFSCLFCLVDAI